MRTHVRQATCGLVATLFVVVAGEARGQAAPPSPEQSATLYRLQLLQAAPGRLLDLIEMVKKHRAIAVAGGEASPVVMRHSVGPPVK